MERESRYLLQKVDCNCNDCHFMVRDFETYRKWEDFHRNLQLNDFERLKGKAIEDAQALKDSDASAAALAMAQKMKFQFDNSGRINYGKCQKFDKPISFLPGLCQLETQHCFEHRLDHKTEQERQKWFANEK